ncbi:hypothetical protein [Pedobacter sp. L105]|uniref:hypothetical protein n=1 Tax=Pedobacter sp. L105 TaxID=1641871 RepID=UPI00131A7127|nr:hypothetical protein [Pedobacter sp. L105]
MILSNDGIDYFVFSFYSAEPGLPLQLVAYARTNNGGVLSYSAEINLLAAHGHSVLEVNGPVIMSNNFIPIEAVKDLIDYPNNRGVGYVVFTPVLNDNKHVYYDLASHKLTEVGEIKTPGDSTNPSPPATMTVSSPYLV